MNLDNYAPVLAFFAHPDDEILAAGGTIKKLTSRGVDVHIAIPATGIHSRRNIKSEVSRNSDYINLRKDCEKAMKALGIRSENIYLGKFLDNEMDKHTLLELVHWLEEIISNVKPKLIMTHHRFCTNIDHQYCYNAAIVASRPDTKSHISLLSGEVPSSTGYIKPTAWDPNFYVELTEDQIDSKIEAMETYEGEARPDPHPRSREVLKALAKVRGSEAGYSFAEAFILHKSFG
jgi:N-acetylglucosamine malate deacetylase 1